MNRGIILQPAAVFDGQDLHEGWAAFVDAGRIVAAGPRASLGAPDGVSIHDLAGSTLLPGLIDLHTHLLLHPYDERSWDDQVLRDPESLRVARAIRAAGKTLAAGFTTVRDLGTEGAGEADVGLRRAFEEGLFPGPRLICVTRAIVARGTYGPKGFHSGCCVPQGADEVDGPESILRVTRMQIARGADWIKVYADYRFGPENEPRPTFSQDELALIVRVAHDAGVPVAAHATTAEGMRRAALAGVQTIEHGNAGTREVFELMAERERGVRADARGVRDDLPDSRLVARRSGGRGEARCIRGGPRKRRDDRERQRHRRLSARRERARAGAVGGARAHAGRKRCRPRRRSPRACCGATTSARSPRAHAPTSSAAPAIPPPRSARCATSAS